LAGPALPAAEGPLAIGASTTVTLTLDVPASVIRFSLTESGRLGEQLQLFTGPYGDLMTFTTCSGFRSIIGAARLFLLVPLLFVATAPSRLLGDVYTFSTIPVGGNISGAPGATIG
jgi:hypothetical protein